MTPPYSEATVEAAARAGFESERARVFGPGCGPSWDEVDEVHRVWARDSARAVLDALAAAGLLVPEEAERRTEWAVWWLGPGGGIRLSQEHLTSQTEAEQVAATRIGDYGIVRWELRYREHRDFADGSCLSGPWSAVPPAPKEDADA